MKSKVVLFNPDWLGPYGLMTELSYPFLQTCGHPDVEQLNGHYTVSVPDGEQSLRFEIESFAIRQSLPNENLAHITPNGVSIYSKHGSMLVNYYRVMDPRTGERFLHKTFELVAQRFPDHPTMAPATLHGLCAASIRILTTMWEMAAKACPETVPSAVPTELNPHQFSYRQLGECASHNPTQLLLDLWVNIRDLYYKARNTFIIRTPVEPEDELGLEISHYTQAVRETYRPDPKAPSERVQISMPKDAALSLQRDVLVLAYRLRELVRGCKEDQYNEVLAAHRTPVAL